MGSEGSVLIVQEPLLHPDSISLRFQERFEKPSIKHIVTKDGLRTITHAPVYNEKYLILFDDAKLFEHNLPYLKPNIMMVLVLCPSKGIRETCVALCKERSIEYKVYVNEFKKDDAIMMVRDLAKEEVSYSFCETLVRRVGLSPQRIVSAMMVCEQVGYKTSNITKYIDKHVYINVQDVIESLLHICSSKAQVTRAASYLHMNRIWFHRYTRKTLVIEMDTLISLCVHLVDGTLTLYNVTEYAEEHKVPRHKIIYATNLIEKKSLVELMAVREFVSKATLLEIVMRLS